METTATTNTAPDLGEEEQHGETEKNDKPKKFRQWLIDRMFGKSQPRELKPPSWVCYVPPCISICPDLFEQNCFCEAVGKVGVINPNETIWRKRFMLFSVFINVVAFALSITACFAISTKFHILQSLPFSSGNMKIQNITSARTIELVTADIGLQAVAYSDDILGDVVFRFDEFCDYNGTGLERFILPSDCSACSDVSQGLIFTLAVSAFPYLPSIFTNVIRMYYNYDINCLKSFGLFANAFSMALAMYSYLGYRYRCFFTFFEGDIYYTASFTQVDNKEDAVFLGTVKWKPGNALLCIIFASALMGIDILFHLLVPSPTLARDHDEQEEYEQLYAGNAEVPESISCSGFIRKFCEMIVGKT